MHKIFTFYTIDQNFLLKFRFTLFSKKLLPVSSDVTLEWNLDKPQRLWKNTESALTQTVFIFTWERLTKTDSMFEWEKPKNWTG